ncbi:MAG: glycosyltransferase [candidate division Zixibacteria bacterium]|nr:glycosyltransferase [candidate division Zixibacteria bacterium]
MKAGLTSIIIINYNTSELTSRLLISIYKHCDKDEFDIILIDNASTDSSVEKILNDFPDIKIIENRRNLGFAKAANQGAASAEGEYLWFLNSDCELTEPVLNKLKSALKEHDNAATVTPKTVNEDGRFYSVCRNFPNYRNILFSRGSLLSKIPGLEDYAQTYTLGDCGEATRVDAMAATAMLVRREDFDKVGGFDERYFLYFEDTDLCLKVNRQGRECYYVPDAVVKHELQASPSSPARRILHHHVSAMEYFLKWYPRRVFANLGLFFMLTLNFIFQIIIAYAGMSRNTRR